MKQSYFIYITFTFGAKWREFKDYIKGCPGVAPIFENGKFKCWRVPIECFDLFNEKAKDFGVKVRDINAIPISEGSGREMRL